jgi:hypothetical protein
MANLDAAFGRSVSVVVRKTTTADWCTNGFAPDIIDLSNGRHDSH